MTLVMNAKDTKQRTFFFVPGASDVFDETKIHWENINSRIFHLEYLLLMKKVDAKDAEFGTTGAGDAFCSGILYGACCGEDLEYSMRLAIACAACSLSQSNGTDGMRSKDEVLALARQYS